MAFAPAKNTSAFLKMGIMGKQGGGKTRDRRQDRNRPCPISQVVEHPLCRKAGGVLRHRTRLRLPDPRLQGSGHSIWQDRTTGFAALLEACAWAEANASVLIIDSITHPPRTDRRRF